MTQVIKLYKQMGETPLECLERLRLANPEFRDANMTYLGRLDPMAEGLLLVLVGDTRGKKDFLEMDKAYEFEVLWGFETDTYDILGLADGRGRMPAQLERRMESLIRKISAKKSQSYPPYSSRTVRGPSTSFGASKSLWAWAREGKIEEIEIPTRGIKIFSLEHIHTRLMPQQELLEDIVRRVSLVKGDFRQAEILKKWTQVIEPSETALISKFTADVSSGTYIRSLAHEMGKEFGSGAIAYSIKRTRVGEYVLD